MLSIGLDGSTRSATFNTLGLPLNWQRKGKCPLKFRLKMPAGPDQIVHCDLPNSAASPQ